jgi:hypothetical protein
MTKIAGSEILQMSLDCLPKHGASSLETLHEAVPTDQQAVANQNYSIPLRFCRDIDDLKEREETLGHCHRKTMRGTMSSWLQCLLVAAALAWTMPAAWGADIRVAFINPTGPPRVLASCLGDDAGRGGGTRD